MNVAAPSLPQRLRLPPRRTWVLPVILAAFVQVDIWGGRLALGHMVGPRPVVALLYAVTSLSLIWCRRAPLAVLAFIVTADSAVYLVFGAPEGLGSFLPVLIAFYAVGRYSEPGNVVFAGPLVFVGIAIHELTDPVYSFGGSDAVFYAVLATGWPLGYAFRRRAVENEALLEGQKETAQAAVTAERARIARELHDVVGHGLSVIVLQLVAALSLLEDAEGDPLRSRLLSIERSARDALAEMRRLLDLLDDGATADLAPQPGLAQLERLVEDTRAAGAEVELAISGERADLPAGVDLAAFRILQESLTNVLKHARPPKGRRRGRLPNRRSDRRGDRPRLDRCQAELERPRPRRDARARFALRRRPRGREPPRRRVPRPRPAAFTPVSTPIRILIADDEAIVRDGLRAIVEHESDLEVVGEAADGAQAVATARQLEPDVVLLDIQMPNLDGIEATKRLLALPRPPRVLVLTTFDRNEYVYETLRAGASGFLLKDVRRGQLTDAIRTVVAGDTLVAPAITRRLIEEFCRRPTPTGATPTELADLTARELEVLELVARGLSNTEIAATLVIAETTIKTHTAHILRKLGLRDRAQAVILAYETGLITPGTPPQHATGP